MKRAKLGKPPRFGSLEEEAKFWQLHSPLEYRGVFREEPVEPSARLDTLLAVRFDRDTTATLRKVARAKGIGATTLLRLWTIERLTEEGSPCPEGIHAPHGMTSVDPAISNGPHPRVTLAHPKPQVPAPLPRLSVSPFLRFSDSGPRFKLPPASCRLPPTLGCPFLLLSPCPPVSQSPCLHVAASPFPRFPVSPPPQLLRSSAQDPRLTPDASTPVCPPCDR